MLLLDHSASVTILSPLQTHQSSLNILGVCIYCLIFQECLLLDFTLHFYTQIEPCQKVFFLIYLSYAIPTSQSFLLVILCQTVLSYYHIVSYFLKLSCLSVTSLLSIFSHLNAIFRRIRTCSILFTTGFPAPRKYLVIEINSLDT